MSSAHGSDEVWLVDTDDISYATKTSTWERTPDIHDITGYGKNSKVKRGGLKDGKFTVGGWYDTGATGPRAILEPLEATNVPITHRPEGTGAGKPQRVVDAVVGKYTETAPVDDIVQWTCEFEMSDDVDNTPQA